MERTDRIRFELDPVGRPGGDVKALLQPGASPCVRLVADPELEQLIRQCLGGRVAEIHYYGAEEGLATGAGNDLQVATGYAERMVRDYGMDAGIGPVALEPRRIGDGPLALELMRAVSAIISSQQQRAVEQMQEHRGALELLVEALMERNRLTREELEVLWERTLPAHS